MVAGLVVALAAACMIIRVSAHDCGGNTNVEGIGVGVVVAIRARNTG